MAVGLYETLDEDAIRQNPEFIAFMVNGCMDKGIPMVTPPGVLGAHIDAMTFCEHIPQSQYPAGALAAAFYLCSGVRVWSAGPYRAFGMKTATISRPMRNCCGWPCLGVFSPCRKSNTPWTGWNGSMTTGA